MARRAVAAVPTEATYYDTLAQVLHKGGKSVEAVEQMHKAVELDPSKPDWFVRLADIAVLAERLGDARKALAESDKLDPDGSKLTKDLKELRDKVRKALEPAKAA